MRICQILIGLWLFEQESQHKNSGELRNLRRGGGGGGGGGEFGTKVCTNFLHLGRILKQNRNRKVKLESIIKNSVQLIFVE